MNKVYIIWRYDIKRNEYGTITMTHKTSNITTVYSNLESAKSFCKGYNNQSNRINGGYWVEIEEMELYH